MMNEMSFKLISNISSDFSFEHDRRMDGRTAAYRDATTHLGIILAFSESFQVTFASFRDFQPERDRPTNQPTNYQPTNQQL